MNKSLIFLSLSGSSKLGEFNFPKDLQKLAKLNLPRAIKINSLYKFPDLLLILTKLESNKRIFQLSQSNSPTAIRIKIIKILP
jgi:hypothetical protein